VHYKKKERAHTDWIYGDIEYHRHRSEEMQFVFDYLSKYSDPKYEYMVFELFLDKLLEIPNAIHFTMREDLDKMISTKWIEKIENNFNKIWVMNQGKINHMDMEGNKQVAKQLEHLIQ
jgi:protoheme ferro-lyase